MAPNKMNIMAVSSLMYFSGNMFANFLPTKRLIDIANDSARTTPKIMGNMLL